MGNSIKPHIDRAEKTGVCQLCGSGLSEFPPDLMRLTKNLRTLDLSDNKIQVLPKSIAEFSMLKSLLMNSNRLAGLPVEFGNLSKLETASFNHNRITTLPATFGSLRSLKRISLCANGIKKFPLELCSLKNLDVVDLSQNKMTALPDELAQLQAIELNVNQNQISNISESVASCPRLKVLRMEENCLQVDSIPSKLLIESHVSLLSLDGNLFEMKQFHQLPGYDKYMERYTATKKKFQ
ncbi:leucine-rich repeat-containing protein 57-like [Glandiceps talaboti]